MAAQILNESNLGAERAEAAVGSRVPVGPGTGDEKLSFTPRATTVFTGALASALELGHNYIGTEHLLLGLIRGDGLAADILEEAGLDRQALEGRWRTSWPGMSRLFDR